MSDGSTNIGSNVAGIGSLLNSLKIDNSVSLDDAEKCIMREFSMIKFDGDSNNGDVDEEEEIDPVAEFEKTIADIDGDEEDASDDDDEEDASGDDDDEDDEDDEEEVVDLTHSRGRDYASSGGRDRRDQMYHPRPQQSSTQLQPAHSMKSINGAIVPKLNIDIERDAEDDRKNQLLEQIDSLRDDLDELGVATDRIHNVTFDSPMRQVVDVHKRLMFKYNKLKYNSIAEEAIVAGAGLLEMVFNGKHEYFGCRPDITGYSDVVKSKLKRIRYETSSAVNRFVTSNNVGGMSMIAMELLPSLITQSQRRRLQVSDTINAGISAPASRESIRSHISDLNSML